MDEPSSSEDQVVRKTKKRSGWSKIDRSTESVASGFSSGGLLPGSEGGGGSLLRPPNVIDSSGGTSRLHVIAQQVGLSTDQARAARELYVCNLPPKINSMTLTEFLNSALVALKGKAVAGNPVSKLTIPEGVDETYAVVEFRTIEEANNATILNGLNCQGYALRFSRTKEYPEALAKLPAAQQTLTPLTSGVVDGYLAGVPTTQVVNTEVLGAAFNEAISRLGPVVIRHTTGRVIFPPDPLTLRNLPPPHVFPTSRVREFLTTFGPLRYLVHFGLPDMASTRRVLSSYITKRSYFDHRGNVLAKGTKQNLTPLPAGPSESCMMELNELPAQEGLCFFDYWFPIDSQDLASSCLHKGYQLAGRVPDLHPTETLLVEDDMLRLAFRFAIYQRLKETMSKTPDHQPLVPTRVLMFENIANPSDLMRDEVYNEILEDIRTECKINGKVIAIELVRPGQQNTNNPGLTNAETNTHTLALQDVAPKPENGADEAEAPLKVEADSEEPPATVEEGGSSMGEVKTEEATIDPAPPGPSPSDDTIKEEEEEEEEETQSKKSTEASTVDVTGWAFVEFATVEEACKTRRDLNGRKFAMRPVKVEYFSEKMWADRDFSNPVPNRIREHSCTYEPSLAAHVPTLLKQIEEAERIGREAARLAATAAANAQFSGNSQLNAPPPPSFMLMDVAKPDFDADVVRDEEDMEED